MPRAVHRSRRERSFPKLSPGLHRGLARVPLIPLVVLTALVGLPMAAEAQVGSGHVRPRDRESDTRFTPRLVEVTLKNGDRQLLRDPEFGSRRDPRGDRRGRGSAPPTMDPGDRPGNHPGGSGTDGPPGFGAPTDPRMPSQGVDGRSRSRRGGDPFLDDHPHLRRLERIVIASAEEREVRVHYEYRNGNVKYDQRVWWDSVTGWERPSRQGEMYYFEASQIDSIRMLEF